MPVTAVFQLFFFCLEALVLFGWSKLQPNIFFWRAVHPIMLSEADVTGICEAATGNEVSTANSENLKLDNQGFQ